jgi:hypothetical protein
MEVRMTKEQKRTVATLRRRRMIRPAAAMMYVRVASLRYWLEHGFPKWREPERDRLFNIVAPALLNGKGEEK